MASVEIISQIAGVAGYAAGQIAEQRALRNAQNNALNLQLEAATNAVEAADNEQQSKQNRMRVWAGRNVLAPIACLGFGAAGLVTYAAKQDPEVIFPPNLPKLEMVVDHSGATRLSLGGTPSVEQIDKLSQELVIKEIKGEALVASDGQVKAMPIDKVNDHEPFGDAPLKQATSLAIDKSNSDQGSVLVITNGNTIGNIANTKQIIRQAKRKKTPVFVVNVENNQQDSNQLNEEQLLAKATGGKYWNANQKNLDQVSASVKRTLVPQEAKTSNPNRWPIIEFGGALLIAGVGYFRRRSKYVSFKSPKGE